MQSKERLQTQQRKWRRRGAGSSLLLKPRKMEQVVRGAAAMLHYPLTVFISYISYSYSYTICRRMVGNNRRGCGKKVVRRRCSCCLGCHRRLRAYCYDYKMLVQSEKLKKKGDKMGAGEAAEGLPRQGGRGARAAAED